MFFFKFQNRNVFVSKIFKQNVITMMFCIRCAKNQKKCRFSSLFRKCAKCIRIEKKCESAKSMINFAEIDRALETLKRKKLKIEIFQTIVIKQLRLSQTKLQRLRKQKKFLKKQKQRMFNKDLNNVKELKRLKNREKAIEIEKIATTFLFLNDFLRSDMFFFDVIA